MLLRLITSLTHTTNPPPTPGPSPPATLGPWILPKVRILHPSLMRDRFRGDLTNWINALTPRLLALWEAEDRQRINENRYTSWLSSNPPEALLHAGNVLVRGNAIRRDGICGQPTPPRPIPIHFIHRLRFVQTPHGIRLDALDEAHWWEWQQAEHATTPP